MFQLAWGRSAQRAGYMLSVDMDVGVGLSPEEMSTRNALLLPWLCWRFWVLNQVLRSTQQELFAHTEPSFWPEMRNRLRRLTSD